MKVVAAGTGPAQGFPVAGCECGSCRQARRDGVQLTPAQLRIETEDGAQLTLSLAATGADAVLSTSDPGAGVLWAPASGQIDRQAVAGLAAGSIGLALLGPGPDGDLTACARSLAVLRAEGVLADDAAAVLIGATHHSVRGARRELLLQAWGLPEAVTGQQWALPGRNTPALVGPELPGRVLVIGGSASGKSQLAEDLLAAAPQVGYLATGPVADPVTDPDWARRVHQHQDRRPDSWRTVETSDPAAELDGQTHPVLLDSLGSWLTGVLDRTGAWDDSPRWRDRVDAETRALVAAWNARAGAAVAVTDEVGWGVIPATESGRLFRDRLGQLNQAVADASDQVIVVVAGQPLRQP